MRLAPSASVVLIAVVAGFIAAATYFYFTALLSDTDFAAMPAFAGAFFGAFFAFVFVRVGDVFTAYSKRITLAYNTLVAMNYRLNTLLTALDDNLYIIDTFEKIYSDYENAGDSSRVFVWANRLEPVGQLGDSIRSLRNIDLINELFTLDIHLRKINDSMQTINDAYEDSKNALLAQNMERENYLENLNITRQSVLEMQYFIHDCIDEATVCIAAVRVLSEDKPLLASILRRLPGHKYSPDFDSARTAEREKLKSEMESIKQKSEERIQAIKSRMRS